MKDFVDRIPGDGKTNRYKLTMENGGAVEYAVIERADEPSEIGTPLNREAFMAVQGFEENTTVFEEDGSITETNALGETLITTFNSDGTIDEVFTNIDGMKIGKRTTFLPNGSISETMIDFTTS